MTRRVQIRFDDADVYIDLPPEVEGGDPVGADTLIAVMPPAFTITVDDGAALALQPFTTWLRELANAQAASMGERLHHANFVVTRNPSIIESWGLMHDCEECRAGVQRALRAVEQIDNDLIVGQLFWAGTR